MFYISGPEDLSKSIGVYNKIKGQIKYLKRELGIEECELICLWKDSILSILFDQEDRLSERVIERRNPSFLKLTYYKHVFQYLAKRNLDKDQNRILFIRGVIFDSYLEHIIDLLKSRNFLAALEIPTSQFLSEFAKDRSKVKGLYKFLLYKKNASKILNKIDIICCVGNLPKYKEFYTSKEKVVVYQNGIDVDSIPLRTLSPKPEPSNSLHLLGVANVSYWHGYDRVIKGLAQYYAERADMDAPNVHFHIVGNGPEIPKLKRLTEELKLGKFVSFHGHLQGEELNKRFDEADIGVASLGLHRIGSQHGSVLKAREYCARGLPFILSYDDPGFSPQFKYMMTLPADDSAVNISDVLRFYEEIAKDDYAEAMRKYAEKHLSWEASLKTLTRRILEIRSQPRTNC